MSTSPKLIDEASLSLVWAKLILHVLAHPGKTISPLIVSITGFDQNRIPEDATFRVAVDAALEAEGEQSPHTVANTIFPQSIWQLAGGDRRRLYALYIQNFPRLQALAKRQNRRGLYFERLIHWRSTDSETETTGETTEERLGAELNERSQRVEQLRPQDTYDRKRPTVGFNQLEWILGQYGDRHSVRRSALQASVFDPDRDHIPDAQLGFPCLQQVSFVPEGDALIVNAFYAKQSLFKKAYGNYLGICRLGAFMAGEMGLKLERVNVMVGVAELEVTKSHPVIHELQQAAQILCNLAISPKRAK